jgi:hypothetical protein
VARSKTQLVRARVLVASSCLSTCGERWPNSPISRFEMTLLVFTGRRGAGRDMVGQRLTFTPAFKPCQHHTRERVSRHLLSRFSTLSRCLLPTLRAQPLASRPWHPALVHSRYSESRRASGTPASGTYIPRPAFRLRCVRRRRRHELVRCHRRSARGRVQAGVQGHCAR